MQFPNPCRVKNSDENCVQKFSKTKFQAESSSIDISNQTFLNVSNLPLQNAILPMGAFAKPLEESMIQAELTETFPSVCKMRTEITHCLFCCPGTIKQPMPYVKTQRKSNYLKGSLFMCQHISALHSVLWKSKGCILEAFQMGKLVEVLPIFKCLCR